MSKAALRKELKQMSHEQLEQIIMDAYDAKREIKEYFEFFLNPDVPRLYEKQLDIVIKEMNRTKWGYSKARVSVIKKAISDFAGYNPGVEHVFQLMSVTLRVVACVENTVTYSPPQRNLAAKLLNDLIEFGDKHEIADKVRDFVDGLFDDSRIRKSFKIFLSESVTSKK